MSIIDLRSDTVTKPTVAMKEAMFAAQVGDDVFGEDPTINALEQFAADMFGMEAGLYCSSGTMTNQIGIKVHTQPGDEVICYEQAHVYKYEGGGIASNSGASVKLLTGEKGRLTANEVENAIRVDDIHFPRTSLVCLENTVNNGSGVCYDVDNIAAIREVCNKHNLKLHLDGARLFNALVAKGQTPKQMGEQFHSISICLSKGLGAPVGSVLLGDKAFIHKARRVRKVFGGGMRQAGIIAAGGLYALQHHVDRLKEDHDHAKQIAEVLKTSSDIANVENVETNIILFDLKEGVSVDNYLSKLKNNNVLAFGMGGQRIRFVTHLDVSREMVERVCEVVK